MAYRRRKKTVRQMAETSAPNLNSLMDIITIILVYFIKTFAASDLEVQDPSVQLPVSSSIENIEETAVVMVTGAKRKDPNGGYAKDIPTIVIDGKVVARLDASTYRVADSIKEKGFIIKPLKKELMGIRKDQGSTAAITGGEGFTGKITVVADEDTPYRVLSDVLVTCSNAGFGTFKFAIIKKDG